MLGYVVTVAANELLFVCNVEESVIIRSLYEQELVCWHRADWYG